MTGSWGHMDLAFTIRTTKQKKGFFLGVLVEGKYHLDFE
jgi:hypothetical protein